ncbi:hypothetical protein OG874_00245 [Nocardia sp. NBC_00565]|uniref:hypothetical protein n=1 Tax=Nocardia sp. NBC_00565 TaxID=2975993 RepID=UPI002E801F4B|nr:hypothetical protein [Nocardia sp. NBC_00565]WUC03684.1 hypothetical protein OG874_00245 [Nocardia sp. NBC_00565]
MKQGEIKHWYPGEFVFAVVDGEHVCLSIKDMPVADAEMRALRRKLRDRNREYGRASRTIHALRAEVALLRQRLNTERPANGE